MPSSLCRLLIFFALKLLMEHMQYNDHMYRSNVGSAQILDLAGDPEKATEMKSRVMSAMVSFGTLYLWCWAVLHWQHYNLEVFVLNLSILILSPFPLAPRIPS